MRNNRTSEEHPLGIFHPHEEVHHIKKENIGLIEVMGLAVLPGRLVEEMEKLADAIMESRLQDAAKEEATAKHVPWALGIDWDRSSREALWSQIEQEIGRRFSEVLEHAGVFKRDEAGQKAFRRFIKQIV